MSDMACARGPAVLSYDFNSPPNERGFYEVSLPNIDEEIICSGQKITFGDSGIRREGRVRGFIAIIEPIGEFQYLDEG